MLMYTGHSHTITLKGWRIFQERCESCNGEYHFLVSGSVVGSGRSFAGLGWRRANQLAVEHALRALWELIMHPRDPRFCPHCGHLDPMFRKKVARAVCGSFIYSLALVSLFAFGLTSLFTASGQSALFRGSVLGIGLSLLALVYDWLRVRSIDINSLPGNVKMRFSLPVAVLREHLKSQLPDGSIQVTNPEDRNAFVSNVLPAFQRTIDSRW